VPAQLAPPELSVRGVDLQDRVLEAGESGSGDAVRRKPGYSSACIRIRGRLCKPQPGPERERHLRSRGTRGSSLKCSTDERDLLLSFRPEVEVEKDGLPEARRRRQLDTETGPKRGKRGLEDAWIQAWCQRRKRRKRGQRLSRREGQLTKQAILKVGDQPLDIGGRQKSGYGETAQLDSSR